MTTGRVVLVGAGPGDPELLTLRAVRALEAADLVLYDALVDRRVLEHAGRAHCFHVGKRAGRHAMAQSTICRLLIEHARAGRVVVRLKAGDPFVFGRGGEEVLACEAAGIPVEVVPGVSSAMAGPLLAGIPLTYRGTSAGFVVLTASPIEHMRRALAGVSPDALTVVLLMALGARSEITTDLLGLGWSADHPAAIVVGASTARSWTWTGRLADLGHAEVPADRSDLPGLVVLGRVVALFERREEEAKWSRMRAP
jgi:uroporphyrin-III C-methyltransferase